MYHRFNMGITDTVNQDALIVCVLLGIFALIGLVDNTMVFRTLTRFKRARVGLFGMAAGLAVSDLLFLVLGVPMGILFQLNGYMELGNYEPFCKIEGYLSNTCGYIAAYHLVAFAVLRAIVLTSRSRHGPNFAQGICCSLGVWLLALVANIPMLTSFADTQEPVCGIRFEQPFKQFLFLSLGFSFVLPLVLIIAIYFVTHIVCQRFCEDSYSAHQIQFSRLVTLVICLFVVCWLPANVLHVVILYKIEAQQELESTHVLTESMLTKFENDMRPLYIMRDYFIAIAHIDKFIRPIIYATKSKDFNKSFDEVINCRSCFKEEDEASRGKCSSTAPLAGPSDATPPEEIL